MSGAAIALPTALKERFHHEWLDGAAALAGEKEAWNRCVEEQYDGNPFLTCDWLSLWEEHFIGPGKSLQCLKIMEEGVTAAYMPLVTCKDRFHRLPARVVTPAFNLYSPLSCPLLLNHRAEALHYFAAKVLPQLEWDVLEMAGLPEEYPAGKALQQALESAGYRTTSRAHEGNRVWEDPSATSAQYFQALTGGVRNQVKRYGAKLASAGRLSFRIVKEDLQPGDVEAYRAVYGRSWKEPEIDASFHPALMRVAARRGWLRLGLLHLDERPIAAQLWLMNQRRAYMVKVAYDEEFRRYSPGTFLMWRIIEQLIDQEGMVFFDLLRGDDPYKQHWAPTRRRRFMVRAYNRNARAQGFYWLDARLLPWVRRRRTLNGLKNRVVASRSAPKAET